MKGIPALVSVKWLAEQIPIASKNMRIVDASWHLPTTKRTARSEYQQKHIPGSVFFDIEACSDDNTTLSHMLPKVEKFEDYVGTLGIDNDTSIVLYDNSDRFAVFSAPRVWWTFRYFGHDNVRIVDGGFQRWCAQQQQVETTCPEVQERIFKANIRPELLKSFDDILANVQRKRCQVLDARSSGRFNGIDPEPRDDVKPGHIPGSINTPFMDITNPDTNLVKSAEELGRWFMSNRVDLNRDTTATCGSGVTACSVALAAYICGKQDVSIYDGSWMEWYQRAADDLKVDTPMYGQRSE